MLAAIHQPQYLPYLGFFHKVHQADILVALDTVEYHRRGIQNRNQIKTSHGVQWLTVPVLQQSKQVIRDVRINPTVDWKVEHWNAIHLNYARARHFAEYGDGYREQLHAGDGPMLYELNMRVTKWMMAVFGVSTPIVLASELDSHGQSTESTERLVDLCRAVGADRYLSGPGGRRYMDLEVFQTAGIEVVWQEFESPEYEQLWPKQGFVPDLAALDALLCWGPGVGEWLNS